MDGVERASVDRLALLLADMRQTAGDGATVADLGCSGGFFSIEAREEELASLRPLFQARDEELASLRPLLRAREEELASIKPVFHAREEELASVKDVLAARDHELS